MQTFQPVDLSPTSSEPTSWGLRNAHDPTIVQCSDGTYVMYSTDACASGPAPAGVHMRTSRDLITWDWAGTALDGVPPEALEWTKATGLWATEVVRWPTTDGSELWRMYYSASTFGSRTSAIGTASAPDPRGPWKSGEVVVKTHHDHSPQNAIDAAITWDTAGTPWLTYGSFFSGLYTLPLDPATGLPATAGDLGVRIASRPRSVEGALEGAYIMNRTEHSATRTPSYLGFVSFDSLVHNYDIRVAHAPHITGPYTDRDGAPMISSELDGTARTTQPDHHGTLLLAGHHFAGQEPLIAPGHNSVLSSSDGDFIVHHVRYAHAPHEHSAQIRRLHWLESGWPVASPMPYLGEPAHHTHATSGEHLAGEWQIVDFRDTPHTFPVHMPDQNDPRLAPCTQSRTAHTSGNLADFGVTEAAVFEVVLPLVGGNTTALAFSGYAQHDTTRTTPIMGIKMSGDTKMSTEQQ